MRTVITIYKETAVPTEIIKTHKMPMAVEEVEDTGACGFRQEWVTAEADGAKVEVLCGAGLASPWVVFHVERDGKKKNFRANIGQFIQDNWEAFTA